MEIGISIEQIQELDNELVMNPKISVTDYMMVYALTFPNNNRYNINHRNKLYKALLKLKSKYETN